MASAAEQRPAAGRSRKCRAASATAASGLSSSPTRKSSSTMPSSAICSIALGAADQAEHVRARPARRRRDSRASRRGRAGGTAGRRPARSRAGSRRRAAASAAASAALRRHRRARARGAAASAAASKASRIEAMARGEAPRLGEDGEARPVAGIVARAGEEGGERVARLGQLRRRCGRSHARPSARPRPGRARRPHLLPERGHPALLVERRHRRRPGCRRPASCFSTLACGAVEPRADAGSRRRAAGCRGCRGREVTAPHSSAAQARRQRRARRGPSSSSDPLRRQLGADPVGLGEVAALLGLGARGDQARRSARRPRPGTRPRRSRRAGPAARALAAQRRAGSSIADRRDKRQRRVEIVGQRVEHAPDRPSPASASPAAR